MGSAPRAACSARRRSGQSGCLPAQAVILYHFKRCPHHRPVAIVAWLLILLLAFNLFKWFARLHGKLLRAGAITLAELTRQLDRELERHEEMKPLWSS